ncbi:MAG TPA: iron dependent repressor, metal binding and dimerization domain protein [Vicinamibacterales bacterium]|nr:iron dependent repressor, metal binding and dimerization domain protein [Vicinamibacterales bacterium]
MTNLLLLAVAAMLAWLLVRWDRLRSAHRKRQQLEDALKHLFEQEYRGRRGTISSLAGVLRLRDRAVVDLVSRMQSQGLLTPHGQEFRLTSDGERLALQVVRAHRLLERYFADEARLPLRSVHAAAERREHSLSPEEVDRLDASLGHPSMDPHGDPIPTREGALAPASGVPATGWPADETGRVVHLEDEPEISFAQIVAAGLRVGQLVRVVESTSERLVLSDGENEFKLAPAVAANVFLAPAPDAAASHDVIRLADLGNGQRAEVVGLDEACQGFSRRRLMDLGFTEGALIRPFLKTFAGDPRAYEVRGTLIALRRDQALQVLVRPIEVTSTGRAGDLPREQTGS